MDFWLGTVAASLARNLLLRHSVLNGNVIIERFNYTIADAQGKKVIDGIQTDEDVPIKFLIFKDQNSGLQLFFTFTPEELEQFIALISGSKIIPATGMPQMNLMRMPKLPS